jgi:hypothetical protein
MSRRDPAAPHGPVEERYMGFNEPRTERLIALVALAAVAFGFPLLFVFSTPVLIFGIPALYLYLFLVWLAVIVGTALISERGERRRPSAGAERTPAPRPGEGGG